MPNYAFECEKCNIAFEEIRTFADYDKGFPDVQCPQCETKELKSVLTAPGAMFADPQNSSKWNNWYYRQGFTAERAKKERAAAELAAGHKPAYKKIDDTDNGRKMNFVD